MNNITLNNRLNSVKDTVNEKKLKRYALDDPSEQVREIAVSKIKDPIILSHIVQNDRSVNVAKKAVRNIDDEYELKRLFIMMSKNGVEYDEEIYKEIINKVTDIEYLIEMIKVNYFTEILEKINAKNPKIIFSLKNKVITKIDEEFLIKYVYSQKKLKQIALNEDYYYYYPYRKLAIQHITDNDFLVKLALTDLDWGIRRDATKHILNQDVLAEIASTDRNDNVQIEALKRIKNPEILLELLLNKSSYVVSKLINRINDQPSLLEITLSTGGTKENLNEETKILYDALRKEVG